MFRLIIHTKLGKRHYLLHLMGEKHLSPVFRMLPLYKGVFRGLPVIKGIFPYIFKHTLIPTVATIM